MRHFTRPFRLISARSAIVWKLVAASLGAVLVLTSCGPSQVQTRKAPIYPCVKQSREDTVKTADGRSTKSPMLGWFSTASFDTWLAHIDRIGQRAGIFAPDSSYRAHALRNLAKTLRKMGMKDTSWIDLKRPLHVIVQQPTDEERQAHTGKTSKWAFGMSAILPTLGQDKFLAAVVGEHVLKDARGHALAVKARGKPIYYDHLNHFTTIGTIHPQRYQLAKKAAMCVHDRMTGRLFDVGFAVGDAWKENKDQLQDSFRDAMTSARRPGVTAPSAEASSKLFEWMSTYIEESDVMELSAHAHERHISIGFASYPYARTRSAQRLQVYRKKPENKLLERLPKSSWWVAGQTNAFDGDVSEYEGLMGFYVDALGLNSDITERIIQRIKESLELTGDHSAMAVYSEGRFPLAFVSVVEAKDAKALVNVSMAASADVLEILIQAMEKAMQKSKKPPKPSDVKILEALKGARGMTPDQWIDKLVSESASWSVKFTARTANDGSLNCRILRADADVQKLRTNRRAMQVMSLTGPTLEMGLCHDDKHVVTLMGPNVVAAAKQVLSDGPSGARLGSQASYKGIRGTEKAPTHLWMLDPAPLIARYGKALPIQLAWPAGEAIGFVCDAEETAMRCEIEIPLAVVDVFRQVRAAFASFGRRKR